MLYSRFVLSHLRILLDCRGYYTVARLAQHGAHVYMCARSSAKGLAAIERIKSIYPQANITLLEMDHMSLVTVVSAAALFLSKERVLHGLVNNAGIMATPFEMTENGHEAQWQTNYLAHWVFTSHLLPIMLSTSKSLPPGSVRIVNLTSVGHFSAPSGGIRFTDTSLPKSSVLTRYGQSKLANVLHTKTLHRLYGPGSANFKAENGEIWTSAVHPGLVESNLGVAAEIPIVAKLLVELFAAAGSRVDGDKGSWTSVFCAASPQMKKEQSGTYFQRIAEAGWQSSSAKNAALSVELETWTEREMKKEGWVK
jgi:NAD(P)-dependent dehydrogenase (short-subunit alcohol dehydrogenase family)